MSDPAFTVERVDAVDCALEPSPWRFAAERAADVDAHWARLTAAQPHLFNGRVLLLHRGGVAREVDGRAVFRGAYREVEFKAFLAWRDFGHPPSDVRNAFAMAALRGSDGAFVLGEMGAHTANAGRVYFPSGTPDRDDVVDGRVDIEGSARRELAEETGLDPDALAFKPGFTLIHDALRVCCMKAVHAPEPADALVARIHAGLARQALPELSRMHVVRREADITPAMPFFVAAYMRDAFAAAGRG